AECLRPWRPRADPLNLLFQPLPKTDISDQIRSLQPSKGENHAQESDVSCVSHGICRWRRLRTGNVREQSDGQGRQAAGGCGKDVIHEEVHGRDLRDQSDERGRQAACGCREEQFHEEVRKGRVTTPLLTKLMTKEPPGLALAAPRSGDCVPSAERKRPPTNKPSGAAN